MYKNIIKLSLLFLIFLIPSISYSYEYCTGEVSRIIARDTYEATEVQLVINSGVSGYARIGDADGYSDHEKIQIALLTSAFMTDRLVSLELIIEDGQSFTDCTEFTRGVKVRNVNLRRNQK
jgi:hypothetical protein